MPGLTNLTGIPDTPDSGNNNSNNAGGGNGSIAALFGNGQLAPDPLSMLINYNDKYKNAPPILFRDAPMLQMLSVLTSKDKPNCLLIGQAGVGKTKLAEELARMIANDDPLIPDALKKHKVYELPISNLVSGSGMLGELEAKTKDVINFACDKSNKAILFIDEIHQLCGGDRASDQIAQILKPVLARGELLCIGATTLQESTKLYSQPAFNRRFSKVIVEELTQPQTAEILKNILPAYLKHHKNKFSISDDVLDTIPSIADQFTLQVNHRPDNAITLMDNAVSNLIMERAAKIVALKKTAANTNDPNYQNAQNMLSALNLNPVINVSAPQIKTQAVKIMKGGAVKENADFDGLKTKLSVIKGQDEIIEKITGMLVREEKNLFPRKKPLTFMFAGPSGVGKTETMRIIAKHLTGRAPIFLNMTEYIHSSAINQIIGSNTGYIGSDSNVELPFDCLESNPYQFILLDEFEKGHKSVQRLFMRVFDEGKLKTNRHQELDFSKCIIVTTTNAGFSSAENIGFSTNNSPKTAKKLMDELKNWFDAELLNRFEHVMPFNKLDVKTYLEIINEIYEHETTRIKQSSRVNLADVIDDTTISRYEAEYNPDFGARPAFNLVKEYIEAQI